MNILHLSQTDIKSDSRILKEMHTISHSFPQYQLHGIGVNLNEKTQQTDNSTNLHIKAITLNSKKLTFVPKILIHVFSVLEIMFKMFFQAKKLKPQIIHCHDTPVLPVGVLLKLFTSAEIIYDAHELESDRNGISKLAGKLTLFTEKLLWRWVDALIVVSPSIEKWYLDKIGDKFSKVILNSPILEKNDSTYDSAYLRKKFNIPTSSKIFLYIGILGKGRGIDLMADVFKKNDINSHLVFLGYGEMSDELRKLSKKYSNIHLHDAVAHEKVVSVAKSADVGMCLIQNVSLSDYYCLPNKMFEYCFSGVPILASNFPDISQAVDKYQLGKYCNLNIESVFIAVKEIENKNDLSKIDTNQLYDLSWKAQEEKLILLYRYLIENKKVEE